MQPISRQEMYGFLGINIVIGYHKLPSSTDYWKGDQDLSVPFVSSVLPRNRFSQILGNLHIYDNHAIPEGNKDKLLKVRPLITAMNNNYMQLYNVSRKVSIDESMILYKGRHSIKQYNPMKPIKRGYKLWVRADMDGYISKFDVYQGKTDTSSGDSEDNSTEQEFGLGEQVVQTMTKDLFGKYHQVYFDNFFTSIPLMEYLKANGVDACGTIRSHRKCLPHDLKADSNMVRGEYDYRVTKQGIVFYKWKDNKSVFLVSNFHGTEASAVSRTQKDGSKKQFLCPAAVKEYNENMGGVDKADMLCAVHGLDRKSKKWWHRIFFGIIDRTLINAYVAYCKIESSKITTLEFRRLVAQTLITLAQPPKVGRPALSVTPPVSKKRRSSEFSVPKSIRLQNRGAHWVIYDKKRGRCEECQRNKVESRPHSLCSMCKVFLCCNEKKNCFAAFHEVE